MASHPASYSCKSRTFRATMLTEFCGNAAQLAARVGRDLHPDTAAMLANQGRRLGAKGAFRCAYARTDDPATVIKVSDRPNTNKREADAWNAVKDTDLAKWFAPVRWISPENFVLVQDRAVVGRDGVARKKWPERMPAIFGMMSDMHASNFGMIGRQIVAIDYPDPLIASYLARPESHEMVDVGWHPKWIYWPLFGGKCGTPDVAADM